MCVRDEPHQCASKIGCSQVRQRLAAAVYVRVELLQRASRMSSGLQQCASGMSLRVHMYVYVSACLCVSVCGSLSLPVCLNGSHHGQHKLERHQDNSVICSDLTRQRGRNAQFFSICRCVCVCVSPCPRLCLCVGVRQSLGRRTNMHLTSPNCTP